MPTKRLPALDGSDLIPIGFMSPTWARTASTVQTSQRGANSGVLALDAAGLLPLADLPATGVIVAWWDSVTGWPARATARTDITVWWVCPTGTADPSGAIVNDRVVYLDPVP